MKPNEIITFCWECGLPFTYYPELTEGQVPKHCNKCFKKEMDKNKDNSIGNLEDLLKI